MAKSVINQLIIINRQLEQLSEQLHAEDSAFKYSINMYVTGLKNMENQFHEVLERDASDDEPYQKPKLQEV